MSVCKNIFKYLVFKINIHCKYLKATIIFKTAPHKNFKNLFFHPEKYFYTACRSKLWKYIVLDSGTCFSPLYAQDDRGHNTHTLPVFFNLYFWFNFMLVVRICLETRVIFSMSKKRSELSEKWWELFQKMVWVVLFNSRRRIGYHVKPFTVNFCS